FGIDNDVQVQASGWGVGGHFGLHARLNDQWSVGLAYKTQVTVNAYGEAKHEQNSLLPGVSFDDCDAHGTVQLPDSLALGVAYKPLDNLSFEVGAVWTRWSTYNSLNIYMDNGNQSISHKNWNDGWNFNASVEYKPLDWWSLRAGFWYETPVINEDHADFMVPSNGRTALTLGTGVEWNDFTIDFAYCHMWINPTSYDDTDSAGIKDFHGMSTRITGGTSKDTVANIYMLSFGYKF
ncbi:OmpP1/FadL family transporter, partial [Desulfovibrio piger]